MDAGAYRERVRKQARERMAKHRERKRAAMEEGRDSGSGGGMPVTPGHMEALLGAPGHLPRCPCKWCEEIRAGQGR
jgi:hypothetical protein